MGQPAPPTPPRAPNPAKDYKKQTKLYLKFLPQLLGAEQAARSTYDPQRVKEQMQLESQFGPEHYGQQLTALNTLDPTGTALREQLGNEVSGDLASGYGLPDAYRTELQNSIRGAQAARGNSLGNAPSAEEAGFLGQAALQLHQQKIQNAGNFLNSPTPEQQLLAVQPVTPDRSSAYVNQNIGLSGQSYGLANYQNLLAQQAASGAGRNPWASALGGAASGASAGAVAGPYGAIIGGVAGGALGYFSDIRFKHSLVRQDTLPNGIPIVEFTYHGDSLRKRGVIAQDVIKVAPWAVSKLKGFLSDFLIVNYDALGLRMETV